MYKKIHNHGKQYTLKYNTHKLFVDGPYDIYK